MTTVQYITGLPIQRLDMVPYHGSLPFRFESILTALRPGSGAVDWPNFPSRLSLETVHMPADWSGFLSCFNIRLCIIPSFFPKPLAAEFT